MTTVTEIPPLSYLIGVNLYKNNSGEEEPSSQEEQGKNRLKLGFMVCQSADFDSIVARHRQVEKESDSNVVANIPDFYDYDDEDYY